MSSFVPITEIDNDSLLIMIKDWRPDIHRSHLTSEINYFWLARDLEPLILLAGNALESLDVLVSFNLIGPK